MVNFDGVAHTSEVHNNILNMPSRDTTDVGDALLPKGRKKKKREIHQQVVFRVHFRAFLSADYSAGLCDVERLWYFLPPVLSLMFSRF